MAGDDKLIRIFKALNFEKQLSLARESEQLRHIFENHIWKVNYRTLKIETFDEQSFDVTNETHLNRVILTNEETMLHFIEFYAEKVKILISHGFYDIQLFKNLTSLSCYGYSAKWCVSQLIEAVARSLEHLESLELRGFPVNNSLGKTKTLNALLQMKKLKSLYMDIYCYKIKYKIFCQLASKLEILKLPGNLEPDENNDNCETENATLTHFDQLRELEIFTTFDPKNWSHKYLEFLSTFKSLTTLSITLTNEIDDCMWTTFVANCQELEKLSISHTNFKNITDFFVPPKLTELKLEYCKGLTYNNLKQMLQEETKLTDYISIYTFYEGEFKDFKITSTMRKLKIKCIDMCIFRSAFDRNDNLKILKWYQRHESCTECMKSLALCTHLETLHLEPLTQVTFEALQKLTHLRKLTTSIDDLTHWSCFIDLLKYSALSNLTIHISVNPKAAPTKGFPINISTLKVNFHLEPDGFVLDFLLDLFCQNPDMKLSFIPFNLEILVKSLVNREKFPTNLKTVLVWGSTLNCDDLRQNFDDTFKDIDSTGNLWEDDDIILCRK